MTRRQVIHTGKDKDGDITRLCKPGEYWSPRTKKDAIDDIESNQHSYYVRWWDGRETDVHVVKRSDGSKYLRTDRDTTPKNNLDDLPNC